MLSLHLISKNWVIETRQVVNQQLKNMLFYVRFKFQCRKVEKKKEFSDLFLIARKKICIVELLCGLHEKRTVLLLHFLVRVFNN